MVSVTALDLEKLKIYVTVQLLDVDPTAYYGFVVHSSFPTDDVAIKLLNSSKSRNLVLFMRYFLLQAVTVSSV